MEYQSLFFRSAAIISNLECVHLSPPFPLRSASTVRRRCGFWPSMLRASARRPHSPTGPAPLAQNRCRHASSRSTSRRQADTSHTPLSTQWAEVQEMREMRVGGEGGGAHCRRAPGQPLHVGDTVATPVESSCPPLLLQRAAQRCSPNCYILGTPPPSLQPPTYMPSLR